MNIILGILWFITMFVSIIFLIISVVQSISKKGNKRKSWVRFGIVTSCSIVLFILFMVTACYHEYDIINETSPTCTEKGVIVSMCNKCDFEKTEYIDELGHELEIIKTIEPTEEKEGKIIKQCKNCEYTEIETIDKLVVSDTEPEQIIKPTPPVEDIEEPEAEKHEESIPLIEETVPAISFDEIYQAYKENELRADDTYKNNRYLITAEINGMCNDGLFNLTGGATLTMQTKVGNTIVFFYAEFEKEQEVALKNIKVGDTITFEGECLSAGTWVDCELEKNKIK